MCTEGGAEGAGAVEVTESAGSPRDGEGMEIFLEDTGSSPGAEKRCEGLGARVERRRSKAAWCDVRAGGGKW